jgi:hypothetical protein
MVPVRAWSATIAETTLAGTLIAGVGVRLAAFGSAVLLLFEAAGDAAAAAGCYLNSGSHQ